MRKAVLLLLCPMLSAALETAIAPRWTACAPYKRRACAPHAQMEDMDYEEGAMKNSERERELLFLSA